MMGLDTKGHGKKVDAVCVVVVDVDREMLFVFFKKTRLVVEGFYHFVVVVDSSHVFELLEHGLDNDGEIEGKLIDVFGRSVTEAQTEYLLRWWAVRDRTKFSYHSGVVGTREFMFGFREKRFERHGVGVSE